MANNLKVWPLVLLLSIGLIQLASFGQCQVDAIGQDDEQPRPPGDATEFKRQLNERKNNYYQTPGRNEANYYGTNHGADQNQNHNAKHGHVIQKCTRQSIILTRQMFAHELNYINQFNSMWFSDLDGDELIEGQKHSLSNIVMSGASTSLLNSNGQPLIEIESSYFRQHQSGGGINNNSPQGAITLRLLRKHQDKCFLNSDRGHFSYTAALSVGPIEHHLDVIYNLPKDLRLSQPIEWRYGQIKISVPKMHYEINFKQAANYKLDSSQQDHHQGSRFGGRANSQVCPLEVSDVTYLPTASNSYLQYQQRGKYQSPAVHGQSISITSTGLALNNQTQLQIERLFDDYTRPTVSHRLRQMLRFYLNSKTFPLAATPTSTSTTTTTTTITS